MGLTGYTNIKPHPKYGTYGYNFGVIYLLLKNPTTNKFDLNIATSVVTFWTKPYQWNKKLAISPQIFLMNSPIGFNSVNGNTVVSRVIGFIAGSTFDYKISKRFGFSINYKAIGSTQNGSGLSHNFLIGSRLLL